MDLDEAIRTRRSNRNFEEHEINIQELKKMLESGSLLRPKTDSHGSFTLFIMRTAKKIF